MTKNQQSLRDILSKYPAYNIVGHIRPDGDCIGSAVAMSHYLAALGKQGFVVRNDAVSANFECFFKNVPCVSLETFNRDLPLICVDCSDYARVGDIISQAYKRPFLVIDHHISNKKFAEHNIISSNAASTTEILARLFEDENVALSKDIAEALYLGILTDTGRFAYNNTTIATFKYAQQMLSAGADPNKIYTIVYENNSIQRYKLLERFLRNIELFSNNRACISYLSASDFAEIGGSSLDTEGFVNYTRELAGVLVGCYVEFHEDFIKCSMRSVDKALRLDLLAEQLGGGGHACAVGFIAKPEDFSMSGLKAAIDAHIEKFWSDYGNSREQ